MDSDYFSNGGHDGDFGFAFNDSNFSDRVLRIEIVADSPETRPEGDACHSLADWARHRKRRREDVKKDNGLCILFIVICEFVVSYFRFGLNMKGRRIIY